MNEIIGGSIIKLLIAWAHRAARASYHLSNDRTLTLIHFVMFLPEMRFQVEIDDKKKVHTRLLPFLLAFCS